MKIRKGWGPGTALIVLTEPTTWEDPWGRPHPASMIVRAVHISRTNMYAPAKVEPGTNGTEAIEAVIYEDNMVEPTPACGGTHGLTWTDSFTLPLDAATGKAYLSADGAPVLPWV